MDSRVALIGIMVEKENSVEELNKLLHQYSGYIVGRMGIPYHKRGVNIISVVIDAPADVISALSGKLGMLDGVTSKAVYSKTSRQGTGSRAVSYTHLQDVIQRSVEYISRADVLIIGGTSLTVYPAAGLIDYYRGSKLVLINKSVTSRDGQADLVICDSIGKVLGDAAGLDQ